MNEHPSLVLFNILLLSWFAGISSCQACGGHLNMSDGIITSPNYPSSYIDNINCVWFISVSQFQRVNLTFTDMDLQLCCDKVQINDGALETAPLYGNFSGTALPPSFISSSNRLYLWFSTDSSGTSKGFRAYFSAVLQPPTVQLVSKSSNALSFNWTRGSKIYDGWSIYFNNKSENITDLAIVNKSYGGLLPDTSYTFSIRCYELISDIIRFCDWTNITSKTDETGLNGKPKNLTAKEVGPTYVYLAWDELENNETDGRIRGYKIRWTTGLIEAMNQTSINITGLTPYMEYTFFVRGYYLSQSQEILDGINAANITVRTGEGVPLDAPEWSLGYASAFWIAVNWSKVNDTQGKVRHYEIQSLYQNITIQIPTLSHNLTGLTPYTRYSLIIRACTSAGCGPFSMVLNVTTSQSTPLTPPEWLSSIASAYWLAVNWTKVNDIHGKIIGYQIQYLNKNIPTVNTDSSTLSSNITGLTPYTMYSLMIRACTSAGCGPFSKTLDVNTSQSNPSGEPRNLSVAEVGSNYVVLTWNEINKDERNGIIRGYKIRFTPSEAGLIEAIGKNSTNITGLSPYRNYTFYVNGYCFSDTQELLLGSREANLTIRTREGHPLLKEMSHTLKNEIRNSLVIETERITFELPSITDVFSTLAGPIASFQLLVVSSSDSAHLREIGNLQPSTWAKSKGTGFIEPYTPFVAMSLSESLQGESAYQKQRFTIGEEDCDSAEIDRICNGPLAPGTRYCIYIRGWTKGGYTDTDCFISEATKSDSTPAIASSAVAVLVLIAIIAVVTVVYRKHISKRNVKENRNQLHGHQSPPKDDSASDITRKPSNEKCQKADHCIYENQFAVNNQGDIKNIRGMENHIYEKPVLGKQWTNSHRDENQYANTASVSNAQSVELDHFYAVLQPASRANDYKEAYENCFIPHSGHSARRIGTIFQNFKN